MDDAEAAALRAQIAALTAAVQQLAAKGSAVGALGDASLARLAELFEASWPRGASWTVSHRSTLRPALQHFGDKPARSLSRADWLFFRDEIRAKQTTLMKRTPEATTLNYEMAKWRAAYRWAIGEGLLVDNPLVTIKPIRAKKHRETEPTDADVELLRPHIDAEGWAYVTLGFRRGLRAIEARRLEWPRIDLDKGTIAFLEAKTHRWRTLRVPSDVVEALRAIRPDVPGRYVFPSPRKPGQPVHATTLWQKVRDAIDAAELQAADGDRRVRFHDLRHGFTSGMARKVPIAAAMKMSRHAGYRSAQRYIHVNEDDLAEAYERLEQGARRAARSSHVSNESVHVVTHTTTNRKG